LIDSYYCSVPSTYISAVLLSLSTMLHLELPHINVLSKIDLVEKYGKLGTTHAPPHTPHHCARAHTAPPRAHTRTPHTYTHVHSQANTAFDLEFFADVGDLDYLLDRLDADPFGKKFGNLNKALCSLIDDYSLVSFTTLNIQVP
jgi:hypothetical protein